MNFLILILVQLVLTVFLHIFINKNYHKKDNYIWLTFYIISLIPIAGLFVTIPFFFIYLNEMKDYGWLPNTKINRFLFKSKFE